MIQDALARLLDGQDLSREESRRVMDSIMSGEATPAQIGGFLVALRLKGETAGEIAGAAEAMRERIGARRSPLEGASYEPAVAAARARIGEKVFAAAWTEGRGMTPEQALATATTNAAALLGKEKELGMIAPGYFADLVAVEGDPLKDINVVVNNVRWVMKGGAVVFDKTKPGKTN